MELELELTLDLVIRGSKSDSTRKRNRWAIGTSGPVAYHEYGVRPVGPCMDGLRARALVKWPGLRTWISALLAAPLSVGHPGPVGGGLLTRSDVRHLWLPKTEDGLAALQRWRQSQVGQQALPMPPDGSPKPDAFDLVQARASAEPDGKAFGRLVYRVAEARSRYTTSAAMGVVQKRYFVELHLDASRGLVRRLAQRNPLIARGFHWLARIRSGAFPMTVQCGPGHAGLINLPDNGSKCCVCKKRGSVDSLEHFLFYCSLGPARDFAVLREQYRLRRLARLVWKAATKVTPSNELGFPVSEGPEPDGLVSLLLGGRHKGRSIMANVKLTTLSSVERELCDQVHGSDRWQKSKRPLASVAVVALARFLHAAMPTRSRLFWSNRTDGGSGAARGRRHPP